MELLVVGAGEMGRWLARTVAAGADGHVAVAYADRDDRVAERAAAAFPDGLDAAARSVPTDTGERFDVVCLAVPIPAVADAVEEHAPRASGALVDVTGVMADPVAAMAEHAPDRERLSMHPLFAAENAPGNVPVVADAPGPLTDRVRAALAAEGNDLFETTPEEHDRAMETVQVRVHAAVLAFGLAAESVPPAFETPVSAAMDDLLERVTGNDPRVYADIQAAFDGAEDVAEAAERIAAADREAFADLYERAGGERGRGDGDGDWTGDGAGNGGAEQ